MSGNTHKYLAPAFCGMDLCWLCVWANFLAVSTTPVKFPLGTACTGFFSALFLSSFYRGKGSRRIWVVLGHITGLGMMIMAAIVSGKGWTALSDAGVYQWYQIILISIVVSLFWYKGAKLPGRDLSYRTVCNYFDLGIALIFLLLMIKLLVWFKGGVLIQESFTAFLTGGYFLFGLTAIFLSRITVRQEKKYLKGFRVVGALVTATIVFLFMGLGIILILMPFMTAVAESGYLALTDVSASLSPYFISMLRYLFSRSNPLPDQPVSQQGQTDSGLDYHFIPGQDIWAGHLLMYVILALFFLMGIYLAGYLAYKLYQFLMAKPSNGSLGKQNSHLLSRLINWILALFMVLKIKVLTANKKGETAEKGFARLVSWGRKSGIPKMRNETPAEYAGRLEKQFMPLGKDIKTIVHALHLEIYGEVPLDQTKILGVARALKTLHSPSFWRLRMQALWKMR